MIGKKLLSVLHFLESSTKVMVKIITEINKLLKNVIAVACGSKNNEIVQKRSLLKIKGHFQRSHLGPSAVRLKKSPQLIFL